MYNLKNITVLVKHFSFIFIALIDIV